MQAEFEQSVNATDKINEFRLKNLQSVECYTKRLNIRNIELSLNCRHIPLHLFFSEYMSRDHRLDT